jgi:hypothetical protein
MGTGNSDMPRSIDGETLDRCCVHSGINNQLGLLVKLRPHCRIRERGK